MKFSCKNNQLKKIYHFFIICLKIYQVAYNASKHLQAAYVAHLRSN